VVLAGAPSVDSNAHTLSPQYTHIDTNQVAVGSSSNWLKFCGGGQQVGGVTSGPSTQLVPSALLMCVADMAITHGCLTLTAAPELAAVSTGAAGPTKGPLYSRRGQFWLSCSGAWW
jgi:hypothetical protein